MVVQRRRDAVNVDKIRGGGGEGGRMDKARVREDEGESIFEERLDHESARGEG